MASKGSSVEDVWNWHIANMLAGGRYGRFRRWSGLDILTLSVSAHDPKRLQFRSAAGSTHRPSQRDIAGDAEVRRPLNSSSYLSARTSAIVSV